MSINRRTFVQGGSAAIGFGSLARAASGQAPASVSSEDLYPDPLYTKPYIDIDEWRDEPLRHRYVHGGFADTDLRFSMYFPPAEQYDGRFFHPLMHISGNENAAFGRVGGMDHNGPGFAFSSGGYYVESNLGRLTMDQGRDLSIIGFRASAATAEYGRILAKEMYGGGRPYGYVFGGSGGAYKTITSIENTDVWDGAVPFIHGSPVSIPNVFTVQAHALRILQGKFEQIVDALDPGGSGDMYAGLNEEERAALQEVTRMGMPPRAWFAHERLSIGYTGVFASLIPMVLMQDPTYVEDFWTKPGYLGHNPPDSLRRDRIQHDTTIASLVTSQQARDMGLPVSIAAGTQASAPAGVRLANMPQGRLQGAYLTLKSGAAASQRLMVTGVVGDMVLLGFGGDQFTALANMQAGDEVNIDNSVYLASQTYHRHQMPPPEFYVWDQFRDADGNPIYPQRPLLDMNQAGEGNKFMTGEFSCKTIIVNCLMDEAAYPWQGDWYRSKVKDVLGDGFEDQYRLWLIDNAMHVNPSRYMSPNESSNAGPQGYTPTETRIISYTGILQQALRDVSAWAEKGIAPPSETSYRVDDGQVYVPTKAVERKGIQPTVNVNANGGSRADVRVGEAVEFVGIADVPPGTGVVVSAEWDFEGTGEYPNKEKFDNGQESVTVKTSYAFSKPGTYFPALRIASQRDGDADTSYARVLNLGRVRVVVT